jgi:hypothetical protein
MLVVDIFKITSGNSINRVFNNNFVGTEFPIKFFSDFLFLSHLYFYLHDNTATEMFFFKRFELKVSLKVIVVKFKILFVIKFHLHTQTK